MAYDEDLAERVRACVASERGVSEKLMFGGLAFLLDGNLAVSASGHGGLMLRVHPADTETLLAEPGARPVVMRGRELTGWLRVAAEAVADDRALARWVARGVGYARSLPAKAESRPARLSA